MTRTTITRQTNRAKLSQWQKQESPRSRSHRQLCMPVLFIYRFPIQDLVFPLFPFHCHSRWNIFPPVALNCDLDLRTSPREVQHGPPRQIPRSKVIFSERELTFTFAICYRPSVCLSSVPLVHPTQTVQIFGNIYTAFGTLAIH